jgi:hypothetical protein
MSFTSKGKPLSGKGKKSSLEGKAKGTGNVTDYGSQYNSFADDVVGDDSESDDEDRAKKSKRRNRDEEEEEKPTPFMLFDFRKYVVSLAKFPF